MYFTFGAKPGLGIGIPRLRIGQTVAAESPPVAAESPFRRHPLTPKIEYTQRRLFTTAQNYL